PGLPMVAFRPRRRDDRRHTVRAGDEVSVRVHGPRPMPRWLRYFRQRIALSRSAATGVPRSGRGGWRDADSREWCDTDHAATMTDLRLAARRLLATPLFTVLAVLSLGVGMAVHT